MNQLVKNHEIQLTDDDCWRAQLPKIEIEYLANGKLRVHKIGMKGKAPSPDESNSLMLAFLETEAKRKQVKWEYQGSGGLGSEFWGDEEEEDY